MLCLNQDLSNYPKSLFITNETLPFIDKGTKFKLNNYDVYSYFSTIFRYGVVTSDTKENFEYIYIINPYNWNRVTTTTARHFNTAYNNIVSDSFNKAEILNVLHEKYGLPTKGIKCSDSPYTFYKTLYNKYNSYKRKPLNNFKNLFILRDYNCKHTTYSFLHRRPSIKYDFLAAYKEYLDEISNKE